MSLDPSVAAAGPKGAPSAEAPSPASLPEVLPLSVTRAEVLPLQDGDRLVVHVDGAAGLSAGGAHEIGEHVRDTLKLDELPFDVPVLVVSPGIRVTVARPS